MQIIRDCITRKTACIRNLRLPPSYWVSAVTSILFEHSPGRGDPAYTGDGSAFDVFLEYCTRSGQTGFLGVEVKYHENAVDTAPDEA